MVVNGNLTVSGTTTTVNSENVTVKDPLMVLSSGATAGSVDSGIIVNRGSDTNVGFIWDESNDHFAAINTTETGTTSGNVTISGYSDVKVNSILIGNATINETIADEYFWCYFRNFKCI